MRLGSTWIVGSSEAAVRMAARAFLPDLLGTRGSAAAARRAAARSLFFSALRARSLSHRAARSGGRPLPLSLRRSARGQWVLKLIH